MKASPEFLLLSNDENLRPKKVILETEKPVSQPNATRVFHFISPKTSAAPPQSPSTSWISKPSAKPFSTAKSHPAQCPSRQNQKSSPAKTRPPRWRSTGLSRPPFRKSRQTAAPDSASNSFSKGQKRVRLPRFGRRTRRGLRCPWPGRFCPCAVRSSRGLFSPAPGR